MTDVEYAKDKNHVYNINASVDGNGTGIVVGADPNTFTPLKTPTGSTSVFAKDATHIFELETLIHPDYSTFEVIDQFTAKDKNQTYQL